MVFSTDLYDILGVPPTASPLAIKKAFRQKALLLHPDKCKDEDATTKFQQLNQAYAILSDSEKREDYDLHGLDDMDEDSGDEDFVDNSAYSHLSYEELEKSLNFFGIRAKHEQEVIRLRTYDLWADTGYEVSDMLEWEQDTVLEEFQALREYNHLVMNWTKRSISFLPPDMCSFTALKALYLGNNELKDLPADIGKLVNLKVIDVRNNKLQTLPNSIVGCKELLELNVENNQLKMLPEQIGHLSQLQELVLFGNQLKKLPDSIGYCTALAKLDVGCNHLKSLPLSLKPLLGQLKAFSVEMNAVDLEESLRTNSAFENKPAALKSGRGGRSRGRGRGKARTSPDAKMETVESSSRSKIRGRGRKKTKVSVQKTPA
eukprot:GCRY01006177.1.p1 GENE.GCRY01006177.1~~GCRY01006177.1.p1  ORF type:complete len:374 (-),score=65.05 GCRY01006177.1:85-1206(-)